MLGLLLLHLYVIGFGMTIWHLLLLLLLPREMPIWLLLLPREMPVFVGRRGGSIPASAPRILLPFDQLLIWLRLLLSGLLMRLRLGRYVPNG